MALLNKTDRIRCAAFEDATKVPASRQVLAYDQFLSGKDTFDIAKDTGLHESIICRWIDRERNKLRLEHG